MNKKGKIIVIEGVDSTGKYTQATQLVKKLRKNKYKTMMYSFPSYDYYQSALAKMYLNGEFGTNINCINYKTACAFFAVDRIATYHKILKKELEQGKILILDRYTTSNMVFQAGKFHNKKDIMEAVNWIENFEFNDLGLPRPDAVIYLSLDDKTRNELLEKRSENQKKDIHESDNEYLHHIEKAGKTVATEKGWHIIDCSCAEGIKPIEEISEEIFLYIKENVLK